MPSGVFPENLIRFKNLVYITVYFLCFLDLLSHKGCLKLDEKISIWVSIALEASWHPFQSIRVYGTCRIFPIAKFLPSCQRIRKCDQLCNEICPGYLQTSFLKAKDRDFETITTLSQIYPNWNRNSKLNTKLRLEFQVEYGFKLEFQVE